MIVLTVNYANGGASTYKGHDFKLDGNNINIYDNSLTTYIINMRYVKDIKVDRYDEEIKLKELSPQLKKELLMSKDDELLNRISRGGDLTSDDYRSHEDSKGTITYFKDR